MTPTDSAAILASDLTTPLRIYLTSGTTVHVDAPGRAAIRGALLDVHAAAGDRLTVERRRKVIATGQIG